MARFGDRIDGAEQLLPKLHRFKGTSDAIVVGLPRGGVITASHIAEKLGLPLSFLIVKKIGAPGDPELAIGAISEDGEVVYDKELIGLADEEYKNEESRRKLAEAKARGELYRGSNVLERFDRKTVILVDDGIATGTTILAAIKAAKKSGAEKVIIAVPVASTDSADKISKEAELIAIEISSVLTSIGEFYDYFPQVEDSEVIKILQDAKNSIRNK